MLYSNKGIAMYNNKKYQKSITNGYKIAFTNRTWVVS